MTTTTILLAAASISMAAGAAAAGPAVPDARVAEVAAMLPASRFAPGPPIDDRAAWARAATSPMLANVVADAERKLAEPVPAMTLAVYGEFKATGERTKHYSDVRYDRHERIALYALAECVENKGRFVAPLEAIIADVCAEPTWLFNFHDKNLDGWNGKGFWVDLGAVMPAEDLSIALVLLGDRLKPETRQLIVDTCRTRILEPYRTTIVDDPKSWANADMNWNAVCHAGIVTTALAICDDRNERAFYVAAAADRATNYLRSFGGDGYCTEGLGYWNYGFGNFAQMAELIVRATGGKLDLFALPGAREAATYPSRLAILDGVAPAYGDCPLDARPDANLSNLLSDRYRLGLPARDAERPAVRLLPTLAYVFASEAQTPAAAATTRPAPLRDFFPNGGVLTLRPAPGGRLGASAKGGQNVESHHHADLGTFVVAVGRHQPIVDPGSEVYSARTFGKDRFAGKLINSFGHAVPIVAGQLQRIDASAARAPIVRTSFTDAQDICELDLAGAYDVPALTSLARTFTYDRAGDASLRVDDAVAFASPQAFAATLITYGTWRRTGPTSLAIEQDGDGVAVTIDAGGEPIEISAEPIDEKTPGGARPTRIVVGFARPVAAGRIAMTIAPLPASR